MRKFIKTIFPSCLFLIVLNNSDAQVTFDSLNYSQIKSKALSDTTKYKILLDNIAEDTLCIYESSIELLKQSNDMKFAITDRGRKNATDLYTKYVNERDKCYANLLTKTNKHFNPVEFKTSPFKKIKQDLAEIDLDNKVGLALMEIESKMSVRMKQLEMKANSGKKENFIEKIKNNLSLMLLPLLLLIVLIGTLIAYFLRGSKLKKIESTFQNENLQKDNKIYSMQKEIDTLKLNSASTQSRVPIENTSFTASIMPSNITPSFFAESFVSAGPRKLYFNDKGEGDIDLGEDIAGFLVGGNYCAFWVLDGTSGQDILKADPEDRVNLGERGEEYFSSRLLAQNIAWNLHSLIKKHGFAHSSFKLLKEAIKLTEIDWQNKIDSLSQHDTAELLSLLQERNMLMCSTTIAFGILGMNRELDVTISGDCVVATHPKQINLDKNNRRQSANMYLDNGKIRVDFNKIKKDNCIVIAESNIDKVIAMSDGISKTTQKWISTYANIDFTNPQIRESLARLKQKTQDDKSVTIIQIL